MLSSDILVALPRLGCLSGCPQRIIERANYDDSLKFFFVLHSAQLNKGHEF